ncbi:MAG: PAS domain S-box protein [Syntrophobacteraceae bacterium]
MTPHKTVEDAEKISLCQGDIEYQGIVKHINEGVLIIRDGKIVFANSALYEILRKGPEEVILSDFSSFISAADRESVAGYCTDRLSAGSFSDRIEFSMPREGGEAIIEMKVSVVMCGGAPAILAALTDITERRKTRIELQKVKERLQSILHSMNEVVVSLSPRDYSILGINPAAEALYGVPLRDFTSRAVHIMRFVHPDDQEKVDRFYTNLPEAEFDEAQYRIISSDKKIKWVLDEGHVVYSNKGAIRRIDHVIRDITEDRKAIDALRESEAKYRDFFESTTDMAFAIAPQGFFIDINDAGLKLLGFENRQEALSSNVKDFYVDPSERTELLGELYAKGNIEGKHIKLRNKAGDIFEVDVTARAKTDDSGNLLYHEGIVHNITKALEDQRNRVLRNAAGSMCHHLNTHLMQLDGSTVAIAAEMKSLDALAEKLAQGENPREIAEQMKAIMEGMRFFQEGISNAYERIAEVTTAFNKAFLYKEESYALSTILDVFKAYGYEAEDSKK